MRWEYPDRCDGKCVRDVRVSQKDGNTPLGGVIPLGVGERASPDSGEAQGLGLIQIHENSKKPKPYRREPMRGSVSILVELNFRIF
jgi:hypothetical protein